jgi:predicted DNA-binding transcriptional regulator AlpA
VSSEIQATTEDAMPNPPDLRDPSVYALSIPEAARLYGQSATSFYRAAKRGAIPTVVVPGTRRVLISAAWLRDQLGVEVER